MKRFKKELSAVIIVGTIMAGVFAYMNETELLYGAIGATSLISIIMIFNDK